MSLLAFIKKLLTPKLHENTPRVVLKPIRSTTIHIESPITLPISDQALSEYSSEDYMNIFDDEVNGRVNVIYTVLTEQCHITPLHMKGTIVPVDDPTVVQHSQNIIIDCDIPADAPIEDIKDTLIKAFEEQYPRQY